MKSIKNKINFDVHSKTAWLSLISLIIAFAFQLLGAFGVKLDAEWQNQIITIVSAVLTFLASIGILTDTNKPEPTVNKEETEKEITTK